MTVKPTLSSQVKIVVVSDSHGSRGQLASIIRGELPLDVIVHCGDGADDLFDVRVPPEIQLIRVSGNMDRGRGSMIEQTVITELAGRRIMVTHGDRFRVDGDMQALIQKADEEQVEIVFFGHTHRKFLQKGCPVLFNPGPANSGQYGVVILGQGMTFQHKRMKRSG